MKLNLLKRAVLLPIALLSAVLSVACEPLQAQHPDVSTQTQTATTRAAIERNDTFITSDPGIEIFVREVRTANPTSNPVLLLHGGGGGGLASYDIDVPGYSIAEDFANAGHPVYILNLRGWEQSTRPAGLNEAADASLPLVTSEEAVRDISAVVDWIQARNGNQRVALVGHASGGHWAGMYTSRHNEKVSHLVMLNSLYGVNAPWEYRRIFEAENRPGEFNRSAAAYREITADGLIANWTRTIPTENKDQWRDPRVVQAHQQIAFENDPSSSTRQPPSIRVPGGFRLDAYNLSKGEKLWNAADIRVPTLYIRGERDHWSRPADLQALEQELINSPNPQTLTIADGTHFLFLDRPERGRDQFTQAVKSFLMPVSNGV
jgi:pimeloyl-ACP methyl ester carboxylesterase